MLSWSYLAIDEEGREVQGVLEAPSPATGAARLRGQGLFPVELSPGRGAATSPAPRAPSRRGGWVRTADLTLFCSQLALMLRAGLTLLQSLDTQAQRSARPALRATAARLGAAVQTGENLSDALERERHFPPFVAQLLRTAEATGELEEAFERAAEHLERQAALRYQVASSLLYPAIVLLAAGGVFWFMTVKVIPKFVHFLAARRAALPWTTQLLMDVSRVLSTYGGWILGGVALAGLAFALAYRTPRGRLWIDRAALRLPGLGGVFSAAGLAHLSRTLALLLRSGVPLVQSLALTSESCPNRSHREAIARAREEVLRGGALAESLEGSSVSPLALQVIAVGESSGSLEDVLAELATYYEARLKRLLTTIGSLVEPAILVIVGTLVGFVYISFFQAVFALAGR
ncbi:MAG: type II secretion system F family protein [Planctomycetes bacterium]|nr:type II secretion system F family protein [Planctomycetota bacterium]